MKIFLFHQIISVIHYYSSHFKRCMHWTMTELSTDSGLNSSHIFFKAIIIILTFAFLLVHCKCWTYILYELVAYVVENSFMFMVWCWMQGIYRVLSSFLDRWFCFHIQNLQTSFYSQFLDWHTHPYHNNLKPILMQELIFVTTLIH